MRSPSPGNEKFGRCRGRRYGRPVRAGQDGVGLRTTIDFFVVETTVDLIGYWGVRGWFDDDVLALPQQTELIGRFANVVAGSGGTFLDTYLFPLHTQSQ